MNAISTESRLDILEREIKEAEYEAFFYIGQRLLEIRRDRLYEAAGFTSWSKYCGAGRLEFRKDQADNYIRASEVRPKLPTMIGNSGEWNVRQIIELAKCETDNDAKRVAKKVIAKAKATGEKVTAKMIAEVRDGETSKPERKQRKELEEASLESHLSKLSSLLVEWRTSLELIDHTQWESVPRDVMNRVVTETDALLKFLKG